MKSFFVRNIVKASIVEVLCHRRLRFAAKLPFWACQARPPCTPQTKYSLSPFLSSFSVFTSIRQISLGCPYNKETSSSHKTSLCDHSVIPFVHYSEDKSYQSILEEVLVLLS